MNLAVCIARREIVKTSLYNSCIYIYMLTLYFVFLFVYLFAEEQISAMQQELDKYGIQMPAFGKIGGILANEVMTRKIKNHTSI